MSLFKNMDSDNYLSDGSPLQNSENMTTIVVTGANLQSNIEFVSQNGLHAEQITMSTIGDTIPYILGSHNHTHVAEEVEIETSSVVGCEDNTNHGSDVIKYDCEITLTLSPISSSTSSASTDTATEGVIERDSQYMQIVVHPVDPSEEKMCRVLASSTTARTTTDYKVGDVKAVNSVRSTIHKSMISLVTEEKMLEHENMKIIQEYSSMNGRANYFVNSSVTSTEPAITMQQVTSKSREETVMAMANRGEIVSLFAPSKGLIDCDNHGDDTNEVDKAAPAPVRASCIKWAKKADMADINIPGPSSAVRIASPSQRKTPRQPLNTAILSKVTDGKKKGNRRKSELQRNAPANIGDITVNTLMKQSSHPLMKSEPPCCFHPCCVMMKGIWPYLPFWINCSQIQTCLMPPRPPGFEDPPESEWLEASVHHVDPSDGALRYKCRSCEGIVQKRSTKQKFQLNYSRLRYQCIFCSRRYITRKQLKYHLLRHNEKTLVCDYCDKRFLTQSELQNHHNTHTGEKPYGCPVCFLRFSHSSRYYLHIRNIHKKYECTDCYVKMCLSSGKKATSPRNVKNIKNCTYNK